MKKYGIEFCWKKPRGKRVNRSVSPFMFDDVEEAIDFANDLLEHCKSRVGFYKYRDTPLICDYIIINLSDFKDLQ